MLARKRILVLMLPSSQEPRPADVDAQAAEQVGGRKDFDALGLYTNEGFKRRLERIQGEVPQYTEAFHRNDCLPNAMLQGLAESRLLRRFLTGPERLYFCVQARRHLNDLPQVALRPIYRNLAGRPLFAQPDEYPPLQHRS